MSAAAAVEPKKSKKSKSKTKKTDDDDDEQKQVAVLEQEFETMEQQMKRMAEHIRKLRKEGEFDKSQFYEGKFAGFMNDFNTLLKEFNRSSDEVEVLSGDRMLEKYKASVAKSWKHKPEKEGNVKPVTTEEVMKKMSSYEQRREELAAKRQVQLAIKGAERLAIEAKPKTKAPRDSDDESEEEQGESSSEEDEEIIERVVVKNDPNPGKGESKAIREKFEAAKKAREEQMRAAAAARPKPSTKTTKPKIEDMDLKDLDDVNQYHNDLLNSDSD